MKSLDCFHAAEWTVRPPLYLATHNHSTALLFAVIVMALMTMKSNTSAASFLPRFVAITTRRRRRSNAINKYQSLIHRFNSDSSNNNNLDDLMNHVLNNPDIILTSSSNLDDADDSQEQSSSSSRRRRLSNNMRDSLKKSTRDGWMRIDWAKMSTERKNSTLEDSSQTNQARQQQQHHQNAAAVPAPSPVDLAIVRGRLVHVKRDDQLRLPGSQISGNKARKLWSLNALSLFHDFPDVVVSYGGPQSNAMLALAAVVHFHNNNNNNNNNDINADCNQNEKKRFVYYTKKLPRFLRKQPSGNLFRAQSLGMELVELSVQEYNDMFGGDWGGNAGEEAPPFGLHPPTCNKSKKALWIPQGAACAVAMEGTRQLANEVISYWRNVGNGRPLSVCIPGGTCSCAVLLHHAIQQEVRKAAQTKSQVDDHHHLDIQVVVIPCVGDDAYARRQMMSLNAQLNRNIHDIPTILTPTPDNAGNLYYIGQSPSLGHGQRNRYFSFGEPEAELLDTFRTMMDEYQIVLDLLYGAPSWAIMLRHWRVETTKKNRSNSNHKAKTVTSLDRGDDDDDARVEHVFDPQTPLAGREIMYIHTGGLEGVNSQLLRYKYKGLVDDVQLPGRSGA
jgi:1-aminocyclopropane-1-carboxylate deaminase/D-cysteine desulfhydrase-like pyridoxal-dependent ACC family enzyme